MVCKYSSRRRRWLTIINKPRRELWSFLLVCKCSVKWLMRCVSNATCTSAEPVSLACVLNDSIVFVFASIVNLNQLEWWIVVGLNLRVKNFNRRFGHVEYLSIGHGNSFSPDNKRRQNSGFLKIIPRQKNCQRSVRIVNFRPGNKDNIRRNIGRKKLD